jgi:hypothetical protein
LSLTRPPRLVVLVETDVLDQPVGDVEVTDGVVRVVPEPGEDLSVGHAASLSCSRFARQPHPNLRQPHAGVRVVVVCVEPERADVAEVGLVLVTDGIRAFPAHAATPPFNRWSSRFTWASACVERDLHVVFPVLLAGLDRVQVLAGNT